MLEGRCSRDYFGQILPVTWPCGTPQHDDLGVYHPRTSHRRPLVPITFTYTILKAQLPPTGSSAPSEGVAIATTDEVSDTKEKLDSKATTSQDALPCTSSGMQMKGRPNFLTLSLQS